ncbi:hypothetical protein BHM03_00054120 [Ensete ventricosum]|nr:hypothetical protein BHM03_00054120 [Ensete ventricosum]
MLLFFISGASLPLSQPSPQLRTTTARRTLTAALFFLCQPRCRWLLTLPPAATQPSTAIVPFHPHRATSRYDSTGSSIATTIFLFPSTAIYI